MSIADRLLAVAENEQRVFDAGKLAALKESRYMNGTASGEVVSVNDVSSVEHEVAVQLSSDTVTDFSQVNVKRYGANLFNIAITERGTLSGSSSSNQRAFQEGVWYVGLTTNNYYYPSNVESYSLDGDSVSITPSQSGYSLAQAFQCKPNQTYYLSVETESGNIPVGFYDAQGNYLSRKAKLTSPFTTPANCYWFVLGLTTDSKVESTFSKVYLSLAPITTYEPYVKPTIHTPNVDGTVEGVRSLSPSMTLVTDADGVTLDCAYLRDIDAYIDSLTGGD